MCVIYNWSMCVIYNWSINSNVELQIQMCKFGIVLHPFTNCIITYTIFPTCSGPKGMGTRGSCQSYGLEWQRWSSTHASPQPHGCLPVAVSLAPVVRLCSARRWPLWSARCAGLGGQLLLAGLSGRLRWPQWSVQPRGCFDVPPAIPRNS